MQAIIEDRGRQYVVHDGETLVVDHMPGSQPGAEIVFDRVLALDGNVGAPLVDGATVKARVDDHVKGSKLTIVRFRRRKDYRRRKGHRQPYTRLTITSIQA